MSGLEAAPRTPDSVTFADIVQYVMKHLKLTETKAAFGVGQVLKCGIALRRIERTPQGRYRLILAKPPALFCRIKDVRHDEDDEFSDWSTSSE